MLGITGGATGLVTKAHICPLGYYCLMEETDGWWESQREDLQLRVSQQAPDNLRCVHSAPPPFHTHFCQTCPCPLLE